MRRLNKRDATIKILTWLAIGGITLTLWGTVLHNIHKIGYCSTQYTQNRVLVYTKVSALH